MQQRRWDRFAAVTAAIAALFVGVSCGAVTEGRANQTLPPLPPPGQGVLITQAPAPPTQAPTATLAPGETAPADDADPLSVMGRFLSAVVTDDQAVAGSLLTGATEPATFDWATATYESTIAVAGESAWGSPHCSAPAGSAVTCTWLQNDANTALVLVQDGAAWRVSHPLYVAPEAPAPIGTGCIVGGDAVNLRGGPAKSWPRFASIAPGTCGIVALDSVIPEGDGPWRYVEVDGQRGWVVDRVLRIG